MAEHKERQKPGTKPGTKLERRHHLSCVECGAGFDSARATALYCKNTTCGAKARRRRGGRS